VEIKSGKTIHTDWFKSLTRFGSLRGAPTRPGVVVYGGDLLQKRTEGTACGIWDLDRTMTEHLR
jgi:hypothetical protein